MSFLDNVGKKIKQTGQDVSQKTKVTTETFKINNMISDEEKSINRAYLQIGKTYYESFGDNPDQLFSPKIAEINDSRKKIAEYTERINQLKGISKCPGCGEENSGDASFCKSCGAPLNTAAEEPATEE